MEILGKYKGLNGPGSGKYQKRAFGNQGAASTGMYKIAVPAVNYRKERYSDGHWRIIRQNGGVGKEGYNFL